MAAATTTPWVDGLTIGEVLEITASKFPDQDALVFPALGYRDSFQAFNAKVDQAARALLGMGIKKGNHVALWSTNVPHWVILQFATAKIGAVLVTINPAYRPFELKYVLKQCDAVALFLVDQYKASDYFGMLREVCPELAGCSPGELDSAEFPELKWVVSLRGSPPAGTIAWESALELGQVQAEALDRAKLANRPEEKINIQYTSGTTGFPKAATLSHRNLLMNAFYVGECQRMSAEDRICIPVPFYHCFGCVLGTLCSAVYGAAMVVPADMFQATATLNAIEQERCTVLYGVPTMYISQLQEPSFSERNLTSLRTGIMSGSPCPIEVMKQVVDKMGMKEITIAYGQTEASPVITQTRTEDPIELRVQTVGRPLPGVEVKIIDPGTGEELPDNRQGELCGRGHIVMLGYYKNPEATTAAIDQQGWLHTGDLAMRIPGGYYKITGRIKDMVIRGGENIYPREIEEFLFTHPAIEQVYLFGIPDEKFGEELCAWVKLKPNAALTAEEVRQYCKGKLAHYKVPKFVKFVESFPQTVTGKIQKFKMRDITIQEQQLREQETA